MLYIIVYKLFYSLVIIYPSFFISKSDFLVTKQSHIFSDHVIY